MVKNYSRRYEQNGFHISFDREKFNLSVGVRDNVALPSQMDGAILVVGATDGVMPQTKEHILLTKHLGIKGLLKQNLLYMSRCCTQIAVATSPDSRSISSN